MCYIMDNIERQVQMCSLGSVAFEFIYMCNSMSDHLFSIMDK